MFLEEGTCYATGAGDATRKPSDLGGKWARFVPKNWGGKGFTIRWDEGNSSSVGVHHLEKKGGTSRYGNQGKI